MKTYLVTRHTGAWRIVVAGTAELAHIFSGFRDHATVKELEIDKAANNCGGVVLNSEDADEELDSDEDDVDEENDTEESETDDEEPE